jgi:hypothetical protein
MKKLTTLTMLVLAGCNSPLPNICYVDKNDELAERAADRTGCTGYIETSGSWSDAWVSLAEFIGSLKVNEGPIVDIEIGKANVLVVDNNQSVVADADFASLAGTSIAEVVQTCSTECTLNINAPNATTITLTSGQEAQVYIAVGELHRDLVFTYSGPPVYAVATSPNLRLTDAVAASREVRS